MTANPLGLLLRNRRAGQHTMAWANPDLHAAESFILTSPAFDDGAPIPERYRGRVRGPNISPALRWTAPPAGTRELVLIVQDPDAPTRRAATLALTIGIDPALQHIPEGGLAHTSPVPGLTHGKGNLGRRGYFGPLPVRSHGPHSYVFQLFAVDRRIEPAAASTLDSAVRAIAGHVLARARLDGTYEIR